MKYEREQLHILQVVGRLQSFACQLALAASENLFVITLLLQKGRHFVCTCLVACLSFCRVCGESARFVSPHFVIPVPMHAMRAYRLSL